MHYIYEYDIAAVFTVIAVMINFYRKKTLDTKITKLFSLLLLLIGIASIFDAFSSFVVDNPTIFPMWINYLSLILFYTSYTAIPMFFHFCMIVSTSLFKRRKFYKNLFLLPYFIGLVSIITSPFTKTVFYYDENLGYHHGFFYLILYAFCAFYLGYSVFIIIKFGNQFSKKQKKAVAFYTVSCVITIVIQAIFDKLMIVCFFAAISGLIIYLSLENPGNFKDKEMNIFNSLALVSTIKEKLETNKSFSVLAIQILGINYISEVLGPSIKSKVMSQLSTLLQITCNKHSLYRYSDNRFVILLNQDEKVRNQLIDRLKFAFEEPFRILDSTIPLTVRFSYFDCPKDSDNLENIMDLIEISLNSIGQSNTGTIIKANHELLNGKRQNTYIMNTLKEACKNNEFQILYQPIYSLSQEKFVGVETKIRFKNPELQNITAKEFLPLAEQNGLILHIESFALNSILNFIKKVNIQEKGIESVFLNVSLFQCTQEQLCYEIIEKIKSQNINPNLINLTITDNSSILSNEKLINNMKRLKSNGLNFAIRDYGSELSSSYSLINLPLDVVELDRNLLIGSQDNENTRNILHHTIRMVKSLQIKVIANGVESESQLEILKDNDCDYVKGNLFSKALSESEFVKFLENNE